MLVENRCFGEMGACPLLAAYLNTFGRYKVGGFPSRQV